MQTPAWLQGTILCLVEMYVINVSAQNEQALQFSMFVAFSVAKSWCFALLRHCQVSRTATNSYHLA